MDRRLIEAAQTGDVDYLLNLVKEDPLMLSAVALVGAETPLHIACMARHLNFVKEIMKLRQEFARDLNQDGFSPLHIASANGDIEIVGVLLKDDPSLCLLKGRERRIPLHSAAIKGRVHVIRDLLSASADSIAEVTARGETALHLAVKYNQFEAFGVLVEHLKQFNKEDVLNNKDDQGNTFLHLAVSRKQYEVVDLVLNEHVVTKDAVEVNSLNESGLTPLDVLLIFQSEAGDREIEDILRQAGAKRAGDLNSSEQAAVNHNQVNVATNNQSVPEQALSPAEQLLDYFKLDKSRDSPSEVRNVLIVIATLIATSTYQAILNPPGGVWQDDSGSNENNNGTNTTKPHTAGRAVMGSHKPISYAIFLFSNSMGFFASLHMIYILTAGFPLLMELYIAMFALTVTYDASMSAITPSRGLSYFFTFISMACPFMMAIATIFVRNILKRSRDALRSRNQETA